MIYLASPYSHPDPAIRNRRFENAAMFAAKLMSWTGDPVFSPIAHSHPIDVYLEPARGWDWWQKIDRPIFEVCSSLHVLQLEGWEASVGIRTEVGWAEELGKPVVYHPSSELWKEVHP